MAINSLLGQNSTMLNKITTPNPIWTVTNFQIMPDMSKWVLKRQNRNKFSWKLQSNCIHGQKPLHSSQQGTI